MGKIPTFPFYASDFDMDTATWENDEVGAYVRLLIYEWVNGGLPEDTYKLAKIVRESERKFREKWKNLSPKFHLNGKGLLINSRLEEVREDKLQYIESQSKKGKLSAKKRWGDKVTPVITTVTERLQPEYNPSFSSSYKEKDILSGEPDPIPYVSIISYLNQKTKKNFSFKTKSYRNHIKARWNEGKREPEFQKVVDIKWGKWGSDPKMVDYLRPETLFGSKMDSYLNETAEIKNGNSW